MMKLLRTSVVCCRTNELVLNTYDVENEWNVILMCARSLICAVVSGKVSGVQLEREFEAQPCSLLVVDISTVTILCCCVHMLCRKMGKSWEIP